MSTTVRPPHSRRFRAPLALGAGMGMAFIWAAAADASPWPVPDLPACDAAAPGMAEGISVGVVQPHASEHLLAFVGRLPLADPRINVCSESWSSVLPTWAPWGGALERGHGYAIFALAFVLVVAVAWRVTPRRWWRRTTLLGLTGVFALTWAVAVAGLALLHAAGGQRALFSNVVSLRLPMQPKPTWLDVAGARELEATLGQIGALKPGALSAAGLRVVSQTGVAASAPTLSAGISNAPSATTSEPTAPSASASAPAQTAPQLEPSGRYRTVHRLNLRSGPGTQHPHLLTLERGEHVQYDGARQGDWWRVRAAMGAVGWGSSLWLRD